MKITAAYDNEGNIVAAVVEDENYDGPRPSAAEGLEVGTFDVPISADSFDLEAVCLAFRVDLTAKSNLVALDVAISKSP